MTVAPVRPTFVRQDERGRFVEVLSQGPWEALLHGQMRAGAVLGHHYHRQTDVHVHVLSGSARVVLEHVDTGERKEVRLAADEGVRIPRNWAHAVRFLEPSQYVMVKSRAYRAADPDTFEHQVEA